MDLAIRQLLVGPMRNFAYVLRDAVSGLAAVVDPGFEPGTLLAACEGARVEWILVTHAHPDHIGAVEEVREASGARLVAHHDSPLPADVRVGHGDVLPLGGVPIHVLHTPGHSPDSVCFRAGGYLLTGDTLFVGDCGRADLPGSDPKELWASLLRTLAALPPDLVVLPGHDYGSSPTSTLGRERRENPTLAPRGVEEFERFVLS